MIRCVNRDVNENFPLQSWIFVFPLFSRRDSSFPEVGEEMINESNSDPGPYLLSSECVPFDWRAQASQRPSLSASQGDVLATGLYSLRRGIVYFRMFCLYACVYVCVHALRVGVSIFSRGHITVSEGLRRRGAVGGLGG